MCNFRIGLSYMKFEPVHQEEMLFKEKVNGRPTTEDGQRKMDAQQMPDEE